MSQLLRPPILDDFGLASAISFELQAHRADGWEVEFLGTNMPHEGILQASALITQLLLGELRRPDVVADIVVVGLYLVLTKHPESVLFT